MVIHHDSGILVSDIEVDASNANREHDIDHETEPVVTHVSRHIHIRSSCKRDALPNETCLTAPMLQKRTLLHGAAIRITNSCRVHNFHV